MDLDGKTVDHKVGEHKAMNTLGWHHPLLCNIAAGAKKREKLIVKGLHFFLRIFVRYGNCCHPPRHLRIELV